MAKTPAAWLAFCAVFWLFPSAQAAPEWKVTMAKDDIRVTGKAPVPDGAFFYVRASFGEQVFRRTKAVVKDGAFDAQFGPFDRPLWAGEYTFSLQFLPGRQLPAVTKAAGKTKLKPLRLEKTVRFGSAKQELEEDKARHIHYSQCVWAAKQHLDRLLDYFCSCARLLPGFVGDEGRELWRNWLVMWHLPSTDPEEATKQLSRWQVPYYFIDKQGAFVKKEWETWIETFRQSLSDALNRHRVFVAQHMAPKYPRSSQDVELLFSTLTQMSARYTAVLMKGKAIPLDAKARLASNLPNAPMSADIDHYRQLLRAINDDARLQDVSRFKGR